MFDYFNSIEVIHAIIIIGSMSLFAVGLVGLFTQKHLIKVFLSLTMMEVAIFIMFVGLQYKVGHTAPILTNGMTTFTNMVDPIPQAMILTTIVIALAILGLGLSFGIEYFKLTGNDDISKMNETGEE